MSLCIVFDIDDTLYLERDYVRSGFEAVGRFANEAWGIRGLGEYAWRAFECGVRGKIFDHALGEIGVTASAERILDLVTRYRAHRPRISLLEDARACLQGLEQRAEVAVITDGPSESQRAKAEALGLGEWAQSIIYTAELGPGMEKPHPRAFELIQERFRVSGAECIYVADNPAKDFEAPRRLGWQTIRVRRPGGLHHERESGADVDCEVEHLRDSRLPWSA